MDTEQFALSALEDRIFALELALTDIGGALLAPAGWEDDQRLHQYMYDTVRRSLLRTGFGDALEQRERQLAAREATPVAQEPAHRTEPVEADAPVSEPAATPEPASETVSASTTLVTSDASPNGPRDYGWPAQS